CAVYLGRRLGYPGDALKPHNLVLTGMGACLLWVGWFGFNAGSALGASGLASSAFVATHFGAAAATLGWMIMEWWKLGKPSVLGAASGAVTGFVAIFSAAGFVWLESELEVGVAARVVLYCIVFIWKWAVGYVYALVVFMVHG